MTATEAKLQQEKVADELANQQLAKIEVLIQKTIKSNSSYLTVDSMSKLCQKKLENLGYKVNYFGGGSGYGGDYVSSYYTITWQ